MLTEDFGWFKQLKQITWNSLTERVLSKLKFKNVSKTFYNFDFISNKKYFLKKNGLKFFLENTKLQVN